jgi:UDP-4-amino-4,6-dideoxy-N-acetyl-beta-L-altrosamine transaminase
MIPYAQQWLSDEDINAVIDVLRSDWITTGPRIGEFEEALCTYTGSSHAVVVNSGTSALDIAVQALDLPPGSEVITTPFTFVATSNAILFNQLRPVFADIDPATRNIDPDAIREHVTERTRAIISVDFAGHPCENREIREIATEHDLAFIEDACHALGGAYRGKRIGTWADMTIFSFHPVKHITTGEGGAVLTDDPGLSERLQMLRNHGIDRSALARSTRESDYTYDMKFLGRNYRLTDFQAAMGISQLGKLDRFLARRAEIAGMYSRAFSQLPFIETPATRPGCTHAWHLYTVLLKGIDRDAFFHKMRLSGIGVNVHYIPIYRFSYYRTVLDLSPSDYPRTEDVFSRIITLPLYPKMTAGEVERVIEAVSTHL